MKTGYRLEYVQPPGEDNPNKVVMERKWHTIEANDFDDAQRQATEFLQGRTQVSLIHLLTFSPSQKEYLRRRD